MLITYFPDLPDSRNTTHFLGLPRSSKARSATLWLREVEGEREAPHDVETSCGATKVAERTGEAMLIDWERVAGIEGVNNELVGSGTDSILGPEDAEKTGSEKTKEDAIVEASAAVTGAIVAEKSSGKSEDVENEGPEDEVGSKRWKSWLESWKTW